MEPTIGEIRMFAGNFAPRSWALCQGQLLAISQNQALFSILGTTYGGDGRTSFGLPDLRGRVNIGPGTGPGLSTYRLGNKAGVENVFLNTLQIPSHTHIAEGTVKANFSPLAPSTTGNPTNNSFGNAAANMYNNSAAETKMSPNNVEVTLGNTGGNLSHTICTLQLQT